MDRLTLVSPYVFVIGYIGYITTGVLYFSLVTDKFSIYYETFLFMAAGLLFYVLGCQFVFPDKKRIYFVLTGAAIAFYSIQEYYVVGIAIPVVSLFFLWSMEKIKAEYYVIIGVVLLTIELVVKGVPLFTPTLRRDYVDAVFIFGYTFLFLGLTFMAKTWQTKYIIAVFLGSLGLLSLFTYRVYVLELVIAGVISLYMLKKIKLIHVIGSALPLFGLILFLGYIGVTYQDWKLNAVELFFYRPAFTFGVLNKIVHEAGYFGITHGTLWLNVQSTIVIGPYLFGYESNITSTVMGPLIFDGGIFELGLMAFFGTGANTVYRKALTDRSKVPYYAILMAMFLVGIDVSFIPSIVLLFLAGLYLVSDAGT
jgi:hypothetical protein